MRRPGFLADVETPKPKAAQDLESPISKEDGIKACVERLLNLPRNLRYPYSYPTSPHHEKWKTEQRAKCEKKFNEGKLLEQVNLKYGTDAKDVPAFEKIFKDRADKTYAETLKVYNKEAGIKACGKVADFCPPNRLDQHCASGAGGGQTRKWCEAKYNREFKPKVLQLYNKYRDKNSTSLWMAIGGYRMPNLSMFLGIKRDIRPIVIDDKAIYKVAKETTVGPSVVKAWVDEAIAEKLKAMIPKCRGIPRCQKRSGPRCNPGERRKNIQPPCECPRWICEPDPDYTAPRVTPPTELICKLQGLCFYQASCPVGAMCKSPIPRCIPCNHPLAREAARKRAAGIPTEYLIGVAILAAILLLRK